MVDVPVEVKKAFKRGRTRKQYRIEVYTINDDNTLTYEFTIGNDNLVKESVKIDERMCSDKYLKFGLCEGSSMEFQYFGMDSITGKELKVYIDVWYDDGNGGTWYPIMMGYYEVDASSTQFSTGIRKVTAYNKLQAKYLDEKANALIDENFEFADQVYVSDITDALLDGYAIEKTYEEIAAQEDGYYEAAGAYVTNKFKYSNLTGDQGPFGPAIWQVIYPYSVTTSTNIQFFIEAACRYFKITEDYPIKIQAPDYFDYIDQEIAEFYQTQLGKIHSSTSASTMWSWIVNTQGDQSSGIEIKNLTNYFFNITIKFKDGTKKYFGNNVLNGSGSFSNLNKLTFLDVDEIFVYFPRRIRFLQPDEGVTFHPPGNVVYNCEWDFTNPSGNLPDPVPYYIPDGSGWVERAYYDIPTMPDGSIIPVGKTITRAVKVYKVLNMGDADFIEVNAHELPEVTLRELQSAIYEMKCQYGQMDRISDTFSGVNLDSTGLYPSETLYPADDLYPNGNTGGKAIHPYPSEYQKLWTDTVGVQSFRYLRITYNTLVDGNEVQKVLQRTVHEHGTQNYNMSDNWLFLNLVWTAEQVGAYADEMVTKMRNITWFPFEMWSVGLPYIETGDAIEIADKEGNTYSTYILQRQLRGIQNLQDTFINGELDVF